MSNLEELIRIRNESIKKQEEALEMIENAIKEYSTTFYNEYLNKMLKNDASSLSKSELTIDFSDKSKVKDISYGGGQEFFKWWCQNITNNNIIEKVLVTYINNVHNETNPIIVIETIDIKKGDETKEENDTMYICPSYIRELAEKDNFSFKVQEPNYEEKIYSTIYTISANVPNLEIPTHKEILTRSKELNQIREDAIEEYQEQLARECNILEKKLMANSIDYYVNELYDKLKSDIENFKCLKTVDYTVQDTGIILETDGPTSAIFFNSIENSSNCLKILKPYDYMKYISINDNPIIHTQSENGERIIRLSYLIELAEKDELKFEVKDICGDKISFSLTKQNLPKLELPKHKVLTLED